MAGTPRDSTCALLLIKEHMRLEPADLRNAVNGQLTEPHAPLCMLFNLGKHRQGNYSKTMLAPQAVTPQPFLGTLVFGNSRIYSEAPWQRVRLKQWLEFQAGHRAIFKL